MKNVMISFLFCFLFMLSSCSNDNEGNTPGLFSADLNIVLKAYSEDVSIDINKGVINNIRFDQEESSLKIVFSDPASIAHRDETTMQDYEFILKSKTVLSAYPLGYKLKVVSNKSWTAIEKVYDHNGDILPYTISKIGEITIELNNHKE